MTQNNGPSGEAARCFAPPEGEEVSFWVCDGKPLVCISQRGWTITTGGNKRALRLIRSRSCEVGWCFSSFQLSFLPYICHSVVKLPPHLHLGKVLRIFIPPHGAFLAELHWCDRQLSCLRRCHKPSKTPKCAQTHFWGFPPGFLRLVPRGGAWVLPMIPSVFEPIGPCVLWPFSHTLNRSRLWSSLWPRDTKWQQSSLAVRSMGGDMFLLLPFLSFSFFSLTHFLKWVIFLCFHIDILM